MVESENFSKERRETLVMGASKNRHNSKKQSKSNARITVVVRKRPLSLVETLRNQTDVLIFVDQDNTTIRVAEPRRNVCGIPYVENHQFVFDRAYSERHTNRDIYESCVRQLVAAVFCQKARCSCFTYGQTGSGKTYTMIGSRKFGQIIPKDEVSERGILELAANDCFEWLDLTRKNQKLDLHVSYFEIYCNKVYDLLNRRRAVKALESQQTGQVIVKDLVSLRVRNVSDLLEAISIGLEQRIVGSNSKNKDSSRGHGILTLEVRDELTGTLQGKLAFIDLAGSERGADALMCNKQTQTDGAGINRSLLALKECIRALDQHSSHIPFRNSELTKILRDMFMGKKAKTLMISCVSPSSDCCEQTLNTLRYADRVKAMRRNCKPDVDTYLPLRPRVSGDTDAILANDEDRNNITDQTQKDKRSVDALKTARVASRQLLSTETTHRLDESIKKCETERTLLSQLSVSTPGGASCLEKEILNLSYSDFYQNPNLPPSSLRSNLATVTKKPGMPVSCSAYKKQEILKSSPARKTVHRKKCLNENLDTNRNLPSTLSVIGRNLDSLITAEKFPGNNKGQPRGSPFVMNSVRESSRETRNIAWIKRDKQRSSRVSCVPELTSSLNFSPLDISSTTKSMSPMFSPPTRKLKSSNVSIDPLHHNGNLDIHFKIKKARSVSPVSEASQSAVIVGDNLKKDPLSERSLPKGKTAFPRHRSNHTHNLMSPTPISPGDMGKQSSFRNLNIPRLNRSYNSGVCEKIRNQKYDRHQDKVKLFSRQDSDVMVSAAKILRKRYKELDFPLLPEQLSDSGKYLELEIAVKMLRGLSELPPEELAKFYARFSLKLKSFYAATIKYNLECLKQHTCSGFTQKMLLQGLQSHSNRKVQVDRNYLASLREVVDTQLYLYIKLGKRLTEMERMVSLQDIILKSYRNASQLDFAQPDHQEEHCSDLASCKSIEELGVSETQSYLVKANPPDHEKKKKKIYPKLEWNSSSTSKPEPDCVERVNDSKTT